MTIACNQSNTAVTKYRGLEETCMCVPRVLCVPGFLIWIEFAVDYAAGLFEATTSNHDGGSSQRAFGVLEPRERLIFKLAVLAGMRPGEIFALRRTRLDENTADIQERCTADSWIRQRRRNPFEWSHCPYRDEAGPRGRRGDVWNEFQKVSTIRLVFEIPEQPTLDRHFLISLVLCCPAQERFSQEIRPNLDPFKIGDQVRWIRSVRTQGNNNEIGTIVDVTLDKNYKNRNDLARYDIQFPSGTWTLYGINLIPG